MTGEGAAESLSKIDYKDIIESAAQGLVGGGGLTFTGQTVGFAKEKAAETVEDRVKRRLDNAQKILDQTKEVDLESAAMVGKELGDAAVEAAKAQETVAPKPETPELTGQIAEPALTPEQQDIQDQIDEAEKTLKGAAKIAKVNKLQRQLQQLMEVQGPPTEAPAAPAPATPAPVEQAQPEKITPETATPEQLQTAKDNIEGLLDQLDKRDDINKADKKKIAAQFQQELDKINARLEEQAPAAVEITEEKQEAGIYDFKRGKQTVEVKQRDDKTGWEVRDIEKAGAYIGEFGTLKEARENMPQIMDQLEQEQIPAEEAPQMPQEEQTQPAETPVPPKEKVAQKPKEQAREGIVEEDRIVVQDPELGEREFKLSPKNLSIFENRKGQRVTMEKFGDKEAFDERVQELTQMAQPTEQVEKQAVKKKEAPKKPAPPKKKEPVQEVKELAKESTVQELEQSISEIDNNLSKTGPLKVALRKQKKLLRDGEKTLESLRAAKDNKMVKQMVDAIGNVKENISAIEKQILDLQQMRKDVTNAMRDLKKQEAKKPAPPKKKEPVKKKEPPKPPPTQPVTKKKEPTEAQKRRDERRAELQKKRIKEINPRVVEAIESKPKLMEAVKKYAEKLDVVEKGGPESHAPIEMLKGAMIGAGLDYFRDGQSVTEYARTLKPTENAQRLRENQTVADEEGIQREEGEAVSRKNIQRKRKARRKDSKSTRRELQEKKDKAEKDLKANRDAEKAIEDALAKAVENQDLEAFTKALDDSVKLMNKKRAKKEGGRLYTIWPIFQMFSLRRLNDVTDFIGWQRMWNYIDEAVARSVNKAYVSQSKGVRLLADSLNGLFGGIARTKSMEKSLAELFGGVKWAPKMSARIAQRMYDLVGNNPGNLIRIQAVLDPDTVIKQTPEDMQAGLPQGVEDLTHQERMVYETIRMLNNVIHQWHYDNGFITKKTYEENKGKYIARMYEENEYQHDAQLMDKIFEFADWKLGGHSVKADYIKQRKELENISKTNILDPVYLTVKRHAQMMHNKAVLDYANKMYNDPNVNMVEERVIRDDEGNAIKNEEGRIQTELWERKSGKWRKVDTIPAGYNKLSSTMVRNKYGDLTNSYVPLHVYEDFMGHQYGTAVVRTMYRAFEVYDRSSVRQFTKQLHTIFAPLVQMGNVGANFMFGMWAGISPITMARYWSDARNEIKNIGPHYELLLKSGILEANVMTADLKDMLSRRTQVEKKQADQNRTIKEKAAAWTKDFFNTLKSPFTGEQTEIARKAAELYGAGDNIPKMAAYLALVKGHGVSPSAAAQKVRDSFQNYNTVGKFYAFAAKTPILGNPYVRFKADLFRIIRNGLKKSPLSMAAWAYMIRGTQVMLSMAMGESDEERKLRESRSWVPRIPFTRYLPGLGLDYDIPLTFLFPGFTEVNIARYISPVYIYDKGASANAAVELSKFLPFELREMNGGVGEPLGFWPFAFNDTLWGVVAQVAFDRDFRNRSIIDPKYTKWEQESTLLGYEKVLNGANYLARSWIPFYKTAADMRAAFTGRTDYFDRERTVAQAIVNQFIKTQKMTPQIVVERFAKEVEFMTKRYVSYERMMGDEDSRLGKELASIGKREISDSKKEKLTQKAIRISMKRQAAILDDMMKAEKELTEFVKKFE
jgi:hypothetical protein